ncbi:1717_t:CDS:2 [Gigaspora margarita]|uniref:1717_t:CDS:1 n=1 Tax=Gigaspora margarita TaxID=4874 RepID=A0ABN7VJV3_GIGMA|nr:1717_t:CDS:2 [Gigaspora margarita]
MCKARIINDNWSPTELPKLKYIWKNNLTCLTIFKAKLLHLEISNLTLDWERKDNARALNLVFNKLFDTRIANGLEKLNLFYLDQLIDSNNQSLFSWPEIKIRSGGMTRGRKPKWFSLLKKKIIEKAEERTIKSKWISGQLNQSVSSILLSKITNDKRKKEWILSKEGKAFKIRKKKEKSIQVKYWRTVPEATKIETRIKKYLGCEHNKSIVEGNCTICIKFDEDWKVILKNAISKIESSTQMQIKLNFISLAQDTYHRDLTKNEQEKGDTAVMGVAVVQMNEKKKVSLKKGSAYTTEWPSSTRAELFAIWIATLISPSKTEVVVKTNSAVSIINIESSKYIAMARQ